MLDYFHPIGTLQQHHDILRFSICCTFPHLELYGAVYAEPTVPIPKCGLWLLLAVIDTIISSIAVLCTSPSSLPPRTFFTIKGKRKVFTMFISSSLRALCSPIAYKWTQGYPMARGYGPVRVRATKIVELPKYS